MRSRVTKQEYLQSARDPDSATPPEDWCRLRACVFLISHPLARAKQKETPPCFFLRDAEGERFELSRPFRTCRLSKAVH